MGDAAALRAALERLTLPREGLCRLAGAGWFAKAVADKFVRVGPRLLRVLGVDAGGEAYEIRFSVGPPATDDVVTSTTRAVLRCLDYAGGGRVLPVQLAAVSNARPSPAELDALVADAAAAAAAAAPGRPRPPPLPSLADAQAAAAALSRMLADAEAGRACAVTAADGADGGTLWGQQPPTAAPAAAGTGIAAVDGHLLDGRHRVAVILRSLLAVDVAVGTLTPPAGLAHASSSASGGGAADAAASDAPPSPEASPASAAATTADAPASSAASVPREWLPCLSGPRSSATSGIVLTIADEEEEEAAGGSGQQPLLPPAARPEALHRGITRHGIGSGPGRRLERAASSYHYLLLHRTAAGAASSPDALAPPCVVADGRYDEYQPDVTALRVVRQFIDDGVTLGQLRAATLAQLDVVPLPPPAAQQGSGGGTSLLLTAAPAPPQQQQQTPSHHPVGATLAGPLQVYVVDADALGAARGPPLLASRGVTDPGKALTDAAAAAAVSAPAASDDLPLSVHTALHAVRAAPAAAMWVRRLTQRHGRVAAMLEATAKARTQTATVAPLPVGAYLDGADGGPGASSAVSTALSPSGCVWVSESQLQDGVASLAGTPSDNAAVGGGGGVYPPPALAPWLPRVAQLGSVTRGILTRVVGGMTAVPSAPVESSTETAPPPVPLWPLPAASFSQAGGSPPPDPRDVCEALLAAYEAGGMFLPGSLPPPPSAASAGAAGGKAGRKRGRHELEGEDAGSAAAPALAPSSSTAAPPTAAAHPRLVALPLPSPPPPGPSLWCPALFPRRGADDGVAVTLYHGTSTGLAAMIAAEGGRLRRPLCRRIAHKCSLGLCDCQMEGFGLYLADAGKARQYALRRANVDPSRAGALLAVTVHLGVLAVASPAPCPCGCGRPYLDHHGAWYAARGCDTLYVRDGSWPATHTAEWAVADPARLALATVEAVAADAGSSGGDGAHTVPPGGPFSSASAAQL